MVHYDPTNRITVGFDLIPVAIARPHKRSPSMVRGWQGSGRIIEMSVKVAIPQAKA